MLCMINSQMSWNYWKVHELLGRFFQDWVSRKNVFFFVVKDVHILLIMNKAYIIIIVQFKFTIEDETCVAMGNPTWART